MRWTRRLSAEERPGLELYLTTPGPLRLALFGAAFFFLAYLPNYFWYMSPRHNYIPSLGWAFFCVGTIAWLQSRLPRLARALPWIAVYLFANAVVANVHEGTEWAYAARLHRGYLREASRFFPAFDNIFIVGAPRYIKKAPVFNLYHDNVLSAALAAGREDDVRGDYQITPTQRGAFYQNDVSVWPRNIFRWLPYERMNAVAFIPPDKFRCARTVRLRDPEGNITLRRLRPVSGCRHELRLDMDVTLVSVKETPLSAEAARSIPGLQGLALADWSVAAGPRQLRLTLDWSVSERPDADLALVPTVTSSRGDLLYEPVYPSPTAGKKTPVIWPLLDDERPASGWRAGRGMRETFVMRTGKNLPPGPCRLKLEVYRLSAGRPAVKAGELVLDGVLR